MLAAKAAGEQVAKKGSGPFDAFVAQQKLTPEQKEFLRRGLKSRAVRAFFDANAEQPSYTRPPGAPGSSSQTLENRARKAAWVGVSSERLSPPRPTQRVWTEREARRW